MVRIRLKGESVYRHRKRDGTFGLGAANIGKSLAADRRVQSRHHVKPGFGDRGDILRSNPGWFGDSLRHSNAAKLGIAGPLYKTNPPRTKADWTKKGFYVKRDKKGAFNKFTSIGKSLVADRRVHAKNKVTSGYGDMGDQVKANPSKDWKENQYNQKNKMVFDKKGKKSFLVHIYKMDSLYPHWQLAVHKNHKVIEKSQFKLKSEALAYAKSYMKKNPQGKKEHRLEFIGHRYLGTKPTKKTRHEKIGEMYLNPESKKKIPQVVLVP